MELKPCPFCGGRAEINYAVNDVPNFFATNGRLRGKIVTYKARCCKCLSMTGEYENPGQAIEAWNRRVSDDKR